MFDMTLLNYQKKGANVCYPLETPTVSLSGPTVFYPSMPIKLIGLVNGLTYKIYLFMTRLLVPASVHLNISDQKA